MPKLKVKEIAEAQHITLSMLQREAKLPMSTARRYWWSSKSGLARDSGTLHEVNLHTLSAIATLLDVQLGDLLTER